MYTIEPKQAMKAQVSYMKKYPNAHGPHSCHTVFSLPAHIYGVSYDLLTEKVKSQVYRWFYRIYRHHPKWAAIALQPLSGTSLKDSGEGKSSQWVELQEDHLVLHFAWKEKWPNMELYTNSWVVANGYTGCSGTWKKTGKLITKKFGEEVCG